MRGTRGMEERYIPGNFAKHSRDFPQTFEGMLSNIPRNVLKHYRECPQTIQGMPQTFGEIPQIV